MSQLKDHLAGLLTLIFIMSLFYGLLWVSEPLNQIAISIYGY